MYILGGHGKNVTQLERLNKSIDNLVKSKPFVYLLKLLIGNKIFQHKHMHPHIYIFSWLTVVEGDAKAPFSIATKLKYN